jgi:dCMP deaminase
MVQGPKLTRACGASILAGMTEPGGRPDHDQYFMGIAIAVRSRALCKGRHVGAVLVKDGRIISTGYNGTPEDMPNCDDFENGCYRCSHPEEFEAGTGYDVCICVHAEQNALLSAARFGTPVAGATLYTTLRPCFGCTKEAVQAKVEAIYYLKDWGHPNPAMKHQYELLQARLPGGVRPIRGILDPSEPTAVEEPLADTGHFREGDDGRDTQITAAAPEAPAVSG